MTTDTTSMAKNFAEQAALAEDSYRTYMLRNKMIVQRDLDPCTIHCLVTGKPIGYTLQEEFDSLVASIPGDDEKIMDELALRMLASMRPSMKWNRLRTESLAELRKSSPVETFCYLMNRLLTPSAEKKRGSDFQTLHRNRIYLYQMASEATLGDDFESVMLMLLEIDAKLNLISEESPIEYQDIFRNEDIFAYLALALKKWHEIRVAYHRQAELEARFYAANPGAKRAYFTAWMDAKPKTEATIKKESKQKEANFMSALLDELIHPESVSAKPEKMRPVVKEAAPVRVVSTKMPMKFGIKKAIA